MPFYLAIIFYITSVVAGIIALFVVRNISIQKLMIGAAVHLIFMSLFILSISSGIKRVEQSSLLKLSFLFTICSGVILFGIVWRSKVNLILKFYFGLYSVTLMLFIFSPSRMINFLLTAKYADTLGKIFPLQENYFLEEQSAAWQGDAAIPHYKLIRKHGLFHEIIQRDISFNGILDSIKLLEFASGEKSMIRGYMNKTTFVTAETDSVDIELKLVKETRHQIERKL